MTNQSYQNATLANAVSHDSTTNTHTRQANAVGKHQVSRKQQRSAEFHMNHAYEQKPSQRQEHQQRWRAESSDKTEKKP